MLVLQENNLKAQRLTGLDMQCGIERREMINESLGNRRRRRSYFELEVIQDMSMDSVGYRK